MYALESKEIIGDIAIMEITPDNDQEIKLNFEWRRNPDNTHTVIRIDGDSETVLNTYDFISVTHPSIGRVGPVEDDGVKTTCLDNIGDRLFLEPKK
jgi:hypothetical protein